MTSKARIPADLQGYEVLVAVCGGIAAYKVCEVVSSLAQRGAGVTVAMTEAATRFVGAPTFAALSGRPVLTSLWTEQASADPQHIRLTESLDLLLIAPATYNVIGKVANGIADDAVSTLICASASPVVLAPAMNPRMWANPIFQANLKKLGEYGFETVGPSEGWLACRTIGRGRMAEADEINEVVAKRLKMSPPVSLSSDQKTDD